MIEESSTERNVDRSFLVGQTFERSVPKNGKKSVAHTAEPCIRIARIRTSPKGYFRNAFDVVVRRLKGTLTLCTCSKDVIPENGSITNEPIHARLTIGADPFEEIVCCLLPLTLARELLQVSKCNHLKQNAKV